MNSELLVCGVKVWIEGRRCGLTTRFWRSVLRRTRTQIILADDYHSRFRRSNLEEIGGLHDRIVAVATDEEVSAFEVEQAVRREREKLLDEEEKGIRNLVSAYPINIERRGEKYRFTVVATAPQVRAMFAAMKGAKR